MNCVYEKLQNCYKSVREKIDFKPEVALVLGSEGAEKIYCERKDLLKLIENTNFEVLMTLGAADLNVLLPAIEETLRAKEPLGKAVD